LSWLPGLGPAATLHLRACARGEDPVDRRWRDRHELGAHVGLEREFAVTLEGVDDVAHERRQGLTARASEDDPHFAQRVRDRRVVDQRSRLGRGLRPIGSCDGSASVPPVHPVGAQSSSRIAPLSAFVARAYLLAITLGTALRSAIDSPIDRPLPPARTSSQADIC
jgi:hypothetical protein